METDALIQKTLKTEFKDRTLLVIAHRMETIMDMDKIMVIDNGRIQLFGPPQELLQNEDFKAKLVSSIQDD
jgi:ABC-type multidrug transport system fused ATPase/permease subunit